MLDELFVVRHAAPDRSLRMPYNVMPGPPLTEAGKREAAQTAAWLKGRGVEHLFASPFERTSATAEAIAEHLALDVTFTEALREGAPGEALAKIQERVAALLAELDAGPLRRVALVTHGACIRGVLMHTTTGGIDLSRHVYDNGNCAPTAGVWRGTRAESGWHWSLAYRPGAEPAPAPQPQGVEWV